jgi:hypothetical protein
MSDFSSEEDVFETEDIEFIDDADADPVYSNASEEEFEPSDEPASEEDSEWAEEEIEDFIPS